MPPLDGDIQQGDLARLRRLTSLAPDDHDLRLKLAGKLLDLNLLQEAIEEIRAVINLVPNHLEARKLLARALAIQLSNPS